MFLLVVGPAAVLCFLAGRVLGNWHLILEKRLESSAVLMLNSTAFAVGGRIGESLGAVSARVSEWTAQPSGERPLVRYAAAFAASNQWTAGIFVFARDGALLYPRWTGRPDGVSGWSHEGADTPEPGEFGLDQAFHYARTNVQAAVREHLAFLAYPGISLLDDCRTRLGLSQWYRMAGQPGDAVRLLSVAPCLGQATDSEDAREKEEGFLLDLVILEQLARLLRQTGDDAGGRKYEVAFMARALAAYDRMVPLQRELVTVYVRETAAAHPARTPEEEGAMAEWRERERAVALDPAFVAQLGRAAVQGSAEIAGAGRPWGWIRAGERSYLCSLMKPPSSGMLCVSVDANGLEREILKTAFRNISDRDLILQVYGPFRAASSVSPADVRGPLLAARRLDAPLDDVTVEAYPSDPESLRANIRLQTRLYTWGGVILAVSVLAGAWFVWREALAEIREARERSDFAAAVSHDLRTPLSSMRMLAESLYMGRIEDPEKRNKFLGVMLRECDRLGRLTDRALCFFRFGQGAMRYRPMEGDLGSLIKDTADTFGASLREGEVALHVVVEPNLPLVRFDAGAMEQVVFNLLDNAVKYSRGKRQAASANDTEKGESAIRVDLSLTHDSRRKELILAVRDYGVGIPRKEQRRIFKAFYRGRHTARGGVTGVGLGLAVCRHVVQAHSGRFEVTSEEGKGSEFRVILPAA